MTSLKSAAVLAFTASSLSGAVIGRWEPNLGGQATSYGPLPSNWDGVGAGNDNYTGNPGDDQFSYIVGTGPAASNRDGRWEDPVPGFPAVPPEQHYTVQPRIPGAFVTDPSGTPNRAQINLGEIPQFNSLVNDFYVDSTFTPSQLGGDSGGGYNVLSDGITPQGAHLLRVLRLEKDLSSGLERTACGLLPSGLLMVPGMLPQLSVDPFKQA